MKDLMLHRLNEVRIGSIVKFSWSSSMERVESFEIKQKEGRILACRGDEQFFVGRTFDAMISLFKAYINNGSFVYFDVINTKSHDKQATNETRNEIKLEERPFANIIGKEYRVTYSKDVMYTRTFNRLEETRVKTIVGIIDNFTTNRECVIISKNGYYIIPYHSIVFLEPIHNKQG